MVEGQKVTVLGAGNAAHTFAWRMASRGTEVMIWEHPDFPGETIILLPFF